MIQILVVEDERPISRLISYSLEEAGYQCVCAMDGGEAAKRLEEQTFDLVLLDVMLPEVDGYELMEYIRPTGTPVIFLTAKSDVKDRIHGLKLGADDYIAKPFEILELLARVEAVLRRCHKLGEEITYEDVVVEPLSHRVTKGGEDISLTQKEYGILEFFLHNPGIALSRDRIYEAVWEGEYDGDSRTVDLHVQRLRRKMQWEKKLIAVYKIGYRLEVEACD